MVYTTTATALLLVMGSVSAYLWIRRKRWSELSPEDQAVALEYRSRANALAAAERDYETRVHAAEGAHKTAVKAFKGRVRTATRQLEEAQAIGTRGLGSFGAVELWEHRINTRAGSARFRDLSFLRAAVQESGTKTVAYDRRTTATRVVAGALIAGPIGAIVGATAKKGTKTETDTRECYLHVECDSFYATENVKPDQSPKAVAFAAKINNAFLQVRQLERHREAAVQLAGQGLAQAEQDTGEMTQTAATLDAVRADILAVGSARAALQELTPSPAVEAYRRIAQHGWLRMGHLSRLVTNRPPFEQLLPWGIAAACTIGILILFNSMTPGSHAGVANHPALNDAQDVSVSAPSVAMRASDSLPRATSLEAPEQAGRTISVGQSTAPNSDEYQSLVGNVWPGYRVYLRTDHAYIGKIVSTSSDYQFEDGTVADAVLIKSPDGDIFPVPRRTAQQMYVTGP